VTASGLLLDHACWYPEAVNLSACVLLAAICN